MRIYWDNKISQAKLTPSNSPSNQDVDLLKSPHLTSTFNFGASDVNLVIDLKAAENIKHFIFDIGTLTGTGTYILEANSTNSWTSPAYSETLNVMENIIYLNLDATYRYFRLKIIDVVDVKIGYISLGDEYLQMPGISQKVKLNYNTTSKASYSVSGQIYGDDGYEYLDTAFSFPQIAESGGVWFDGTPLANRKDIINMWESVKNINPVWVMLWEKNLDEYPPLFCVINEKKLTFTKLTYDKYYSTKFKLKEVK